MSHQSLVSPGTRERVRSLAAPIAVGLGRLGLTPNHLTLIGFGIAVVAAAAAAQQAWLVAGLLVIGGAVFDLFDGALARATGRASKFGAFMDSVFDRWGEAVVYIGVAAGAQAGGFAFGSIMAAAAMASAFLVSYVRAKAEGLGYVAGSGMAQVGLAPREVRIVILTVGLIASGATGNGQAWLAGALGLITVLATITVIQRIWHVRAQALGNGGR
jgi:phosphatidylglycerophosphate synthase